MSKVQVDIPAVVTNLGAGQHTLGLALSLHAHIEMLTRTDGSLKMSFTGEGSSVIPTNFKNPVLKAATRLFQHHEKAPAGLEIKISNYIPLEAGLEVEAALTIGGLVAANNLIQPELTRDQLIDFAVKLGIKRVTALSALMGGLNLCLETLDGSSLHKSLEPPPLKVIVFVPALPDYAQQTAQLPPSVTLEATLYNIGRMPFLIDAIMGGDFALLTKILPDQVYDPHYTPHLPGYANAAQAAREQGAAALTIASQGPTLLVFAPFNHNLVIEAMREAFRANGVTECRHWVLGLDAQGVTVSVAS